MVGRTLARALLAVDEGAPVTRAAREGVASTKSILIQANIWQVLHHDYTHSDRAPKVDVTAQVEALDDLIQQTRDALTSKELAYEDGLPMLRDLRARQRALRASQETVETFHTVLADFRAADVSRQAADVRGHVSAILVKPIRTRGSTVSIKRGSMSC